ncbi:hypothetical protein IC619_000195 [Hazenella sp. IB182353]|uniref:Imm30 family immunity protein n=1 Tax=Polycladospora coralii TaxID=2771432 RepID=UPI001745C7CF|nr:Imm30 family immunity protein [Polycladospora coralii]MBS7528914.1 hypothetical protein [Polycladospora coralii]
MNNRMMSTEEEFILFEEALASLYEKFENDGLDEQTIEKLYLVLDDNCEAFEVMWGLLHFLEEIDRKGYYFVQTIPQINENAPEWMELMLKRRLNHKDVIHDLKQLYLSSPDIVQYHIKSVLNNIQKNNPDRFHEKVKFVLDMQ